jgi:hypothetical protein
MYTRDSSSALLAFLSSPNYQGVTSDLLDFSFDPPPSSNLLTLTLPDTNLSSYVDMGGPHDTHSSQGVQDGGGVPSSRYVRSSGMGSEAGEQPSDNLLSGSHPGPVLVPAALP